VTSSAESADSAPSVGGAELRIPHIRAVSSWAAYPYAKDIADRSNSSSEPADVPASHIDVSEQDSDMWPGPMCNATAPDIAYAFRLTGTVSERPCPPDASGHRSPVIAVLVGYETVVLARSPLNGELDLTRRQIFLALAKWVPDPARPGAVRENASATWQQVDPALLPVRIQVMGPPLESAAGHSMIELLLEEGCDTFPWIAALESTDPARHARICRTVRRDGAYVASHGLDAADLLAEPNAVGIFGLHGPLSFYSLTQFDLNGLAVSSLDGVKPTQQGIVSGTYPGSRGLYLYVNRLHVAGKFAITLVIDEAFPYRDWAVAAPPPSQLTTASSEIMAPH
jgi:phosphate transport system substrate-binding protein